MLTKARVLIGIVLIVTFGTPTMGVQRAALESLPAQSEAPFRNPTEGGRQFDKAKADLEMVNFRALRMAVRDLMKSYPDKYTQGESYLAALDACEKRVPGIYKRLARRDAAAVKEVEEIVALQRATLLSNPLMDFERLLLIKRTPDGDPRRAEAPHRGLGIFLGFPRQSSWQLPKIEKPFFWENEIAVLSPVRGDGRLSTLYKPNAWGLHDMHGNTWEWTRSAYRPYPYTDETDGAGGDKTVRGGSWYDRPKRCRSAFRLRYPEWQKVYNVGFRIVVESDSPTSRIVMGQ